MSQAGSSISQERKTIIQATTYCQVFRGQMKAGAVAVRGVRDVGCHLLRETKHAVLQGCDRSLHKLIHKNKNKLQARQTSDTGLEDDELTDSSLESYIGAEDVQKSQKGLLDPAHQFTAQQVAKRLDHGHTSTKATSSRTRAAELARFALMRRMGAALVRCIERDVDELKRLNGQLYVDFESVRSRKWWKMAIGTSPEEISGSLWKVAAAWAQQDLEARGFGVDLLTAKVSDGALKTRWRLTIP